MNTTLYLLAFFQNVIVTQTMAHYKVIKVLEWSNQNENNVSEISEDFQLAINDAQRRTSQKENATVIRNFIQIVIIFKS